MPCRAKLCRAEPCRAEPCRAVPCRAMAVSPIQQQASTGSSDLHFRKIKAAERTVWGALVVEGSATSPDTVGPLYPWNQIQDGLLTSPVQH